MEKKTGASIPIVLLKGVAISYILTGIAVLIMTMLVWKTGITEKILHIIIIVVYGISSFLAGLYCGRKLEYRRFLWGLTAGALYFCVLMALSWTIGDGGLSQSLISSALICLGCGMFGGMLG